VYDLSIVARFVEREYGDELRSGKFSYDHKSYRLWHGLQSVKNRYRKPIMTNYGYAHHYDIRSCAPTLLSQYSRQLGNDQWMPGLEYYLEHRNQVRNNLASELSTDVKTIKVLINALFCGAKLSVNTQSSVFCLLDSDAAQVEYLKQHEYVTELRTDIKTMWEYINQLIPRRRDAETLRLKQIRSSERWQVYFRLESEVMTCIRLYLNRNQIRSFNEHDGWCSDKPVDLVELTEHVYQTTGFKLEFDYVCAV
jgi:hypothetical protein